MYSRSLHRYAVATTVATLGLLGVGGLVTSHGAGLAVPDWPNTYGYNMFFFPFSKWMGGIFYEHTHRLVAAAVGLLTGVLALWLYGRNARSFMRWSGLALLVLGLGAAAHRWTDGLVLGLTGLALFVACRFLPSGEPSPKWLRRCGVAAFIAVVLQGVLGGLRVVLLKDAIGIVHATLAQLFFVLLCAIALFTSRWWQTSSQRSVSAFDPRLSTLFLVTSVLILCQLTLGATMRHQHAGLAIPDFPLAYGQLWPATDPAAIAHYNAQRMETVSVNPITAFQVNLQMVHRLLAVVILVAVGVCAGSARRALGGKDRLSRLSWVWLGLVVVQGLLGAATIWSNKAADIATAHVLVGALCLAIGAMLTMCLAAASAQTAADAGLHKLWRFTRLPLRPSPRPSTLAGLS